MKRNSLTGPRFVHFRGSFEVLEERRMLAGMPQMLLDMGRDEEGAWEGPYGLEFEQVGGLTYFVANDGTHGKELWKTDGTTAGTQLVRDIAPEYDNDRSYGVSQLTNVNGTLFFAARDGGAGGFYNYNRLWQSDGTEAGTLPVFGMDEYGQVLGEIPSLVNVNGVLYFSFYGGDGSYDLWRSDGTAAGTYLVKDVGWDSSSVPRYLTNVNGTLFFLSDSAAGERLWKSDGTEAGTSLIATFDFKSNGKRTAGNLTAVGDTLYLSARDAAHGLEAWRSDGTAAGTYRLGDLNPGSGDSFPQEFTAAGELVYFSAKNPASGFELWQTDGTAAGTHQIVDLWPGPLSGSLGGLTELNGALYFHGDDGVHGSTLWQSDGTAAGTQLVRDSGGAPIGVTYGSPANINGVLYFQGIDEEHGREVWSSDGTSAGTRLVADIVPGPDWSRPEAFMPLGGGVAFAANDGIHGYELWYSDGTAAGTALLKNINLTRPWEGGDLRDFTDVNDKAFFVGDGGEGNELWHSDGTSAGTRLVKDIRPAEGIYSRDSNPEFLTNVGGTLFFAANDGTHGIELWKSDGTPDGTVLVKDIRPGGGSSPRNLANIGGTLYFVANDGTHGFELWKSDGTTDGTILVADIRAGALGSDPSSLIDVDGKAVFIANDGGRGAELWKSDGSAAGTFLLKDINGAGSADISSLTLIGGSLYFAANDGAHGSELWHSDGTAEGTHLLKDIVAGGPASHSSPGQFVDVEGTVFFAVANGWRRFLWQSDGTAAGTSAVGISLDGPAVELSGVLIFAGPDGLWRSDGTLQGTWMVLENLWADQMIVANGSVYIFSDEHIWRTDGTTIGTILLDAAWKTSYDEYPHADEAAKIGDLIYFSAHTIATAVDPWIIPLESPPAILARHLFYNNSFFDGYTPGASDSDDGAIALQKAPDQEANEEPSWHYQSTYVHGINGIMVDIANTSHHWTVDDFSFLMQVNMGRYSLWTDAPLPSEVVIRSGAGVFGSDRVTIIWPDGAIRNRWLRVTVEGNDAYGGYNTRTGLSKSDIFLWESNVGGSGTVDAQRVFSALGANKPITEPADFNRDGKVSTADAAIVFANLGSAGIFFGHIGAREFAELIASGTISDPAVPRAASPGRGNSVAQAVVEPLPREAVAPPAVHSVRQAIEATTTLDRRFELSHPEVTEDLLDLLARRGRTLRARMPARI